MGLKPRTPPPRVEPKTSFLNVDLDLESQSDLVPLIEALGPVYVLHQTHEATFVASLEIEEVGLDCRATISALLDLVDALDEKARQRWDNCTLRRFDIGIQSGIDPRMVQYDLPARLVKRIAAAGSDLVVTVYGARDRSPLPAQPEY